jgi:alcohol dehydrogenase
MKSAAALEGRAAVCLGPNRPLDLQSFPIPQLQPREVLVRVSCATICASDLHTVHGRRSGPIPCVLGHEIVGTIAALGPEAPRLDLAGQPLALGDRVTWTVAASCAQCFFCEHDLPQKCEALFKYGHTASRPDRPFTGGYAEYCVLVGGTGVLRVPDALPDALAATANCTTSTVAAAMRLLKVTAPIPGSTVFVLGAGALGLNACAMLRESWASHVVCCDTDPARAKRALDFGATHAVTPAELPALRSTAFPRGFDAALEFSGASVAVTTAIDSLRIGGTALLVGTVLTCPSVPLDPEMVVRRMLTIRGLHNYAPLDLVTAVDFLAAAQHRYPLASLIADSYPLDAINSAFRAATQRPGFRIAVCP